MAQNTLNRRYLTKTDSKVLTDRLSILDQDLANAIQRVEMRYAHPVQSQYTKNKKVFGQHLHALEKKRAAIALIISHLNK